MIKAERIVLSRAEGPVNECVTVEVKTFAEADKVLRKWRETAPGPGGGYDKTDFIVFFQDGEDYQGRIDLERDNPDTSDLAGHIREFAAMRERDSPTFRETNQRWMSKYQIGDTPNVHKCFDLDGGRSIYFTTFEGGSDSKPEGRIFVTHQGQGSCAYLFKSEDAYNIADVLRDMGDWLKERGV